MVSSGIPLHQALAYLSEQEADPEMRRFFDTTLQNLERGESLAASLRGSSQDVGALNLALIEIAEQTGSLETTLRKIVDFEVSSEHLKKRLLSQLIYPVFLGVFALLTVIFLPGYCLEGMVPVLKAQGGELPLLTRGFFWLSEATRSYPFWVMSAILVGVAAFLIPRAWNSEVVRSRCLDVIEVTPVARTVLEHWQLAFLSDCLSLQLSVGLSPLRAFPLAAQALNDPRALERSQKVVLALKDGQTIPESLQEWPNLPKLFLSMAEVGEQSGRWPSLLKKLAEYHHQELEHSIDQLVTLLEPITLSVMGILFGLMIIATLTPMLKLIEGLS